MVMMNNRDVGGEINRINEIILQTSGNLITEGTDPTRKLAADVVDAFITPKGLDDIFKKLGLKTIKDTNTEVVGPFIENFDALLKIAKKTGDEADAWDNMINTASKTRIDADYFDVSTGVKLTDDKVHELWGDAHLPGGLWDEGVNYTSELRYYIELADGTLEPITKVEYKKIIDGQKDFESLPPFLRFSKKEIESMLAGVTGNNKILSVDEFLVALNRFLKGGDLTEPLRRAILSTLGNVKGFTVILKNAFMKNDAFARQVKFHRITDSMDDLYKAVQQVLGFEDGAKFIDELNFMFSRSGALIEEYFSWFKKSWGPWKAVQRIRLGQSESWFRTYVLDIGVGIIWDYVIGAQIIKSLVATIKASRKVGADAAWYNKLVWKAVFGVILFGGFKTFRDWAAAGDGDYIKALTGKLTDAFKNCAGESKITDALTGKLYSNVAGTAEVKGEDGILERIKCPDVEFSAAFLKEYTWEDDDEYIKTAAESLYNTLNLSAHDGNPITIGKNEFGLFGDGVVGKFVKGGLPSLTKVFVDYVGLWRPDTDIVKNIVTSDGMDILKMSQISNYYEKNFDASLLEDAVNLNQWEALMGGMNFKEFQSAIEKLPYLNGESVDFNTWENVITEAEKLFIKYPFKGVFEFEEDGGTFEETVPIAKCGDGCINDNNDNCNCGSGGCNIGGTVMGVAVYDLLHAKGYKTQADINGLVKTKDGFKILKDAFDKAETKNGIGCRLIGSKHN